MIEQIVGFTFGIIGLALIGLHSSWWVAIGVFLARWRNNLGR